MAQTGLPDMIEFTLDCGAATVVQFNRCGTLLAVGTAGGVVVVWDFETRSIARALNGHSRPINSLSWSRNGRWVRRKFKFLLGYI